MTATFPQVWTGIYGESSSIGSLNYLSIAIGLIVAAQGGTRIADKIYKRLSQRNGDRLAEVRRKKQAEAAGETAGEAESVEKANPVAKPVEQAKPIGKPEFRLPILFFGSCVVPIGLFWYGWSARPSIFWVMPDIGAALFGGATVLSLQCIQTYLVDTYGQYSSSAQASVTVLKSLLGFALPLCAPNLFAAAGFAWGNSILAFIAIGIGIPAPFLLWKYGEALRARSLYARSPDPDEAMAILADPVPEKQVV